MCGKLEPEKDAQCRSLRRENCDASTTWPTRGVSFIPACLYPSTNRTVHRTAWIGDSRWKCICLTAICGSRWGFLKMTKSWIKGSAELSSSEISGIKLHLFSTIRDDTSGREIWGRLESLYQPRRHFRWIALLKELDSIRCRDCPNLHTYITRRVNIAISLEAIDNEIS